MKKGILAALSFLLLLTTASVASAAEDKPVKVTKTYDLAQNEKYVEFTLEGTTGMFTVEMVMPDGHKVSNKQTKEIAGKDKKSTWKNSLVVTNAPKGKYTFNILAPVDEYYNLVVHIPLFSDIGNHWAESDINAFVQKGIVTGMGNGEFQPDSVVTGEQLITMAVRAMTEENPAGMRQWTKSFRFRMSDANLSKELGFQEFDFNAKQSGAWSKPYMDAAGGLGVTKDWNGTQLAGAMKRKDVALFVANIIFLTKVNEPQKANFTDTGSLDEKYQKAIDLLSNFTIISGYPDGTFGPEKTVTRAEAVKILSRLVDYFK